MAKKKMTRAQAASARRPDDWEPPQNTPKKSTATKQAKSSGSDFTQSVTSKENRKTFIIFGILFVAMAIAAPFIVIFVSNLLGLSNG